MEVSTSVIALVILVWDWVAFFFATCRPGQFLLREGEENLPSLWKAIQKELEQGLEPHFLRAHPPWAISLWTPLMGGLRNSG